MIFRVCENECYFYEARKLGNVQIMLTIFQ